MANVIGCKIYEEINKSLERREINIEQASFNNRRFVMIREEKLVHKSVEQKLCFIIILFGYIFALFLSVLAAY